MLYGYIGVDWDRSSSDMKSASGICFCFGSTMISWFIKKWSNVSLNTTEEEYIVAFFSSCESIWLQELMLGLFDLEFDTTMILCENQSCIEMMEKLVFHVKSKNI